MFKPMLACSTIPLISELDYPVMASPKLDGIRCLIVDGKPVSRSLKPIPNKFVQRELAKLDLPKLDGELMLKSHADFNSVQSAFMSEGGEPDFYLVVFDSFSSPKDTYIKRFERLADLLKSRDTAGRIELVENHFVRSRKQMEELYAFWLGRKYEGAIVRKPEGPYKFGRSTMNQGWMLKLKTFNDMEAEIIGVEELMHNGNEATVDALGHQVRSHEQAGQIPGDMLGALVCRMPSGEEFKIGTGFTIADRCQLWDIRDKLIGKLAAFKFQELSKYGVPRFPVYRGLRDPKDM